MSNRLEVQKDVKEVMTSTQRERYNVLYQFYNEDAAAIVRKLKRSGQNSFASVYEKAVKINKAKPSVRDYYGRLSDELAARKKVNDDQIIQIVTEVRSEHDLQPFLKRIKTQCLQEFYNLFIFEEVTTDDELEEEPEAAIREYEILYRLFAGN